MNFTQRMSLGVAAAALMGAGYTAEVANAATDQMTVTAEVVNDCGLTAEDLAFGAYVAGNSAKQGDTIITYNCAAGLNITIEIGASAQPPASGNGRQMVNNPFTQALTYDLYQTSDHNTRWGLHAQGHAVTVEDTAGVPTNIPVFGLIDGGQNVLPDFYSDTVTVTLTING